MSTKAPGPWAVVPYGDGDSFVICSDQAGVHRICFLATPGDSGDREEIEANARLIAAAPDHALVGWAMCIGAGRWEPLSDRGGEFCINGIRHLTKLDEFGVPEMTAGLRRAILHARGDA